MNELENADQVNPFASPTSVDTDATPLAAWASDDASGLRYVRIGLQMVYVGICGILICAIAIAGIAVAAGQMVGPAGPAGPAADIVGVWGIAMISMMIAAFCCWFLLVLGPWFCLGVPTATGAKGLIIGSVLCSGVGLLYSVAVAITLVPQSATIGMVANVLGAVGSVLFILFMRRLAVYIGRDDLVRRANRVLILGAVMFAAGLAFGILGVGAIAAGALNPLLILLPVILLILGLVLFVMYANLVNYLRKAIAV